MHERAATLLAAYSPVVWFVEVRRGGSLLVGSVARSDLLGPDLAEQLAEKMYHSLHDRILGLPDHLPVYPTHGAGSFCAAAECTSRTTTIGQERLHSRMLQLDSAAAFVQEALRDLPPYPRYFRRMRSINQDGPRVLGGVPELQPLSAEQAEPKDGRILIDTRVSVAYGRGHVPDSVSIGLSPSFGTWVGWLLPHDVDLTFLSDGPAVDDEVARQLIRIGYERLSGRLDDGLEGWRREGRMVRSTPTMSVSALAELLERERRPTVVDVRHENEWRSGHIVGSLHLPLPDLQAEAVRLLPRTEPLAVHCAASYRSGMAVSLLERLGYDNVFHVLGGFDAWRAAGQAVARPLVTVG